MRTDPAAGPTTPTHRRQGTTTTTTIDRTQDAAALSPRRAALVAGTGYVALFAFAIFANFAVREAMVVAGDAARTAANIRDAEGLFRLGLEAFLAVFLIDVPVAWALYVLFRPVHRDLSLLTAWFRIVYTVFLGVATVSFFQALQLLDDGAFLAVFTPEQLDAQVLVALDTFDATWRVGLLAFGVHVVLLGRLALRSGRVPRALGWILVFAGLAYMADTVARAAFVDLPGLQSFISALVIAPAVVAEGWFGLWLLTKGGKMSTARGNRSPE